MHPSSRSSKSSLPAVLRRVPAWHAGPPTEEAGWERAHAGISVVLAVAAVVPVGRVGLVVAIRGAVAESPAVRGDGVGGFTPRALVGVADLGLHSQTKALDGFVDVTAPPFDADASGMSDATTAIQNAIDWARCQTNGPSCRTCP